MVICLEWGADLHMAQLVPLPLTVSCSRLVLPFWYRLTWVVPDKGPLNGCVCVCVCVCMRAHVSCDFCRKNICLVADAVEAATVSPRALAKQLQLGNTATLERRIRQELEDIGLSCQRYWQTLLIFSPQHSLSISHNCIQLKKKTTGNNDACLLSMVDSCYDIL